MNTFNVEMSSAAYYEAPINVLVGRLYRSGTLPLWNPYQAAGLPLLAQYSSRALFPYQIAEDVAPVSTWDAFMLGRLWIAGFFTFLFLRALPLGWSPALLGGVLYMLSGAMVWWISFEQMTNVAMVAPLLLLAVRRDLRSAGRWDFVLLAVAVALVLLGGQPEVALFVLLLAALYALFVGATELATWSLRLRAWSRAAAALVIGMALAAPVIVPFIEGMREMVSIHPAGSQMGVRGSIPSEFTIGFFLPTVFEYPIAPRQLPDNGLWDFLGAYVGVTPLFLIAFGLVAAFHGPRRDARGHLLFFTAFSTAVLLKNLGWPPFTWIGHLPLFDITWSPRWSAPAWALGVAVAGAAALEILGPWRSDQAPAAPRNGRRRALLLAVALVIGALLHHAIGELLGLRVNAAIGWLEKAPANAPLDQHAAYFWPSIALSAWIAIAVIGILGRLTLARSVGAQPWAAGVIAVAATELWYAIPRGYPPAWAALEGVPVLCGFLAVAACAATRWRLAAAAAVAAVVAFVVIDQTSPAGYPDRFDPFRSAPYVEFLARQPGHYRMVAGDGVLIPNFASALGVQDLRYVAALAIQTMQAYRTHRLHAHTLVAESGDVLWFNGQPFLTVRSVSDGVVRPARIARPLAEDFRARLAQYSFLGVKHFVLPAGAGLGDPATANGTALPLVYDREVRIYENPAVLPRAFIARRVQSARDFDEAQRLASAPGFDARGEVVLERPAPAGYAADTVAVGDRVSITRYEASRITVEGHAAAAGVLVLTDVHYPGWSASVNGERSTIYRVNGLVRGVFVPAGPHVVEFVYRPASFLAGVVAAAGAAAVCGAVLVIGRRRRVAPSDA